MLSGLELTMRSIKLRSLITGRQCTQITEAYSHTGSIRKHNPQILKCFAYFANQEHQQSGCTHRHHTYWHSCSSWCCELMLSASAPASLPIASQSSQSCFSRLLIMYTALVAGVLIESDEWLVSMGRNNRVAQPRSAQGEALRGATP